MNKNKMEANKQAIAPNLILTPASESKMSINPEVQGIKC